jgi:hypothetical protein
MFDSMVTGLFIFLSAVLAYDTFKKWRGSQKVLYLVGIGLFVLAAMSAFVDWGSSIFCILGGLVVRLIAQNSGSKKGNEVKKDESDEGNLD